MTASAHKQNSNSRTLRRLRAARHGGNAGARDFDEADRPHEFDELVNLADSAGQFENKTFDRRVDYPCAKSLGETQGLVAVLSRARDLDHRKLALDGIAEEGEIGDLMDRNEALQLMADLLDCLRRP